MIPATARQVFGVACSQCGLLLDSNSDGCPMDEFAHSAERAVAGGGVAVGDKDYYTNGIYGVARWLIYRRHMSESRLHQLTKENETTDDEFAEFVMVMDLATGALAAEIPPEWKALQKPQQTETV